ncbi:MAG: PAS domain S-box protein [Thermodesulfobacteriota bacterium]
MNYDEKSRQELINENIDLLIDLTKCKNKIKELDKNISKLSVAFHSIGDGIIIVDKERDILLFNPVAERLTGWSIQKARGASSDEVLRLVNDKTGQTYDNPALKAIETGEAADLDGDAVLISSDGTKRFISGNCSPIFDDRNRCSGAVLVFRDISGIRKAEESVIESEAKYRALVENSRDLIYEVSTAGKVLYVNPVCSQILGFEQQELLGTSAFDLIHPDDLPRVMSEFGRAIMSMSSGEATYRARDKSGRYHWFECTGNPVRKKNGEIVGVVITRDITDRREAQTALARSEALFRAIFDRAAIGIALVDPDGRPKTINPALGNMLGYSEEEIKSMVFTEFTHPEDASKDWALFRELNEGRIGDYQMEKRYFHKNGQIVHGLLNVSLIKGLEGNEPYVLATVVDITERMQTEAELSVLNNLMQAVHRFLDLDEVYKVALDMVVGTEIVDMAMIYLVDEEKKEAVLQAERNVPETYVRKAGRIPHPKGNTWRVIETASMINIENAQNDMTMGPAGRELGEHSALGIPIFIKEKVIGVLWFFSVKERKFTEKEIRFLTTLGDQIAVAVAKAKMMREIEIAQEQLIQSEKMASIGRLISSIAHEINNPLTPIVGYSRRLLEKDGHDEQERHALEVIYNSAQRVVRIIDKLLSFSRKSLPVRSYEDINGLIEQALEFREYQYRLGNVEIVKKLDPGLPKTMVDPNQIQQVLMNLLLNAEQAIVGARGSGRIEITSGLGSGGAIEITVSDDGPGIPDEIRGKVFDPFFTTKEPGEGTGLGLSVSYGIVKEHGGDIYIREGGGEGATFVVELPLLTPGAGAPDAEKYEARNDLKELRKIRVLIVEDEVVVISLLKTVLEELGHAVEIASNGKEAIRGRDLGSYDLIVCDIRMPDMNGVEFFEELRKSYPELTGRVIFITGDPSRKTAEFLDRVGNPYLIKPFKIEKFKDRVNEILSGVPHHPVQ